MRRWLIVWMVALLWVGCGEETDTTPTEDASVEIAEDTTAGDAADATETRDAADTADTLDPPDLDGDTTAEVDATADAGDAVEETDGETVEPGPLGSLSGACGELDAEELDAAEPFIFRSTIDFGADPFDDPEDVDRLSEGGQTIYALPNAGGSSKASEIFAFEVLHRCEMAALLKTENEITYTAEGSITDLLVEIDTRRVGVSVTRAFKFQGTLSTDEAKVLLEDKLQGVLEASANVSEADAWVKQILFVMAYNAAEGDAVEAAWPMVSAELRADTVVVVTQTDGDDAFLY